MYFRAKKCTKVRKLDRPDQQGFVYAECGATRGRCRYAKLDIRSECGRISFS